MQASAAKRFIKINLLAIITLFVLILAGGVVRSSGSGMGCPDWPKCFDQYIPPIHVSQLPANYQQKYVAGRVAKNARFAKTLDVLGYGDLAIRIREDRSILKPEEFNASRTWTEYVNRLIGAICGVFLLGCVIFSFPYLTSRKRIFFLSLFNVFLVGFQAWLGSIVVSTNLLAWVVTVHMLLALAILAIAIYTYSEAKHLGVQTVKRVDWKIRLLALSVIVLSLVQITLGTEVREQIDAIASAMNNLNRAEWVAMVGLNFNFHRDLAILVLVSNIFLFQIIAKRFAKLTASYQYATYSLGLIALQLLSGVALSYFALPPVAQASHILLASLLFGAQFYVFLSLRLDTGKEGAGE
ncbi:MAG: COX15/CtaA family protein [Sphingobacteriaceae bacterium]